MLIKENIIATSWESSGTENRNYGIDRQIQLLDGTILEMQIKSSKIGKDHAKQNFPHIAVIQVIENESLENLSSRIRGLIQAKLKGKF